VQKHFLLLFSKVQLCNQCKFPNRTVFTFLKEQRPPPLWEEVVGQRPPTQAAGNLGSGSLQQQPILGSDLLIKKNLTIIIKGFYSMLGEKQKEKSVRVLRNSKSIHLITVQF